MDDHPRDAAREEPTPPELRILEPRVPTSHKGTYGNLLIVAGSYGMHGAAALMAGAAFRSGVGLVTLAVPQSVYPMVGAAEIRATYLPLPETHPGSLHPDAVDLVLGRAARATAVAIGPGLGRSLPTLHFARTVVPRIERPLILDADGLNAFAGEPSQIGGRRPATVVTPHPGELERLTGHRPGADDDLRRVAAIDLAMRVGGVVILKGHRSVITDGIDTFFNTTGNPGMATGGSGDVLSGIVGALLCVAPDALRAARAAAHVHGLAGDRAARRLGETAVTATDLIEELPAAIRTLVSGQEDR